MKSVTQKAPTWLHFGAGNIFRAFPAVLAQRLLECGEMEGGIICCEGYDDEIVTQCFHPHDDLSIAVTLHADGQMEKEIVASIAKSVTMKHDAAYMKELFAQTSLQMVSFTITEKGYAVMQGNGVPLPAIAQDIKNGPAACQSFLGQLAAFCLHRFQTVAAPLELVSMDNCSHNGEKLQAAVMTLANGWLANGFVSQNFLSYLTQQISFPWSMIDKITPRPDARVQAVLEKDGFEQVAPFETTKHTFIAPFVNAEKPQYLVVEDLFPNGRPPLENAGVIFTSRETVNQVEKMKVCTCLNPLHTALAVLGCLLGYASIAQEMQDDDLVSLITRMSQTEGMPVVVDPGIISPQTFLREALTERFPNPYMPDTP